MRDDHALEVSTVAAHHVFEVREPSQVGEVRRSAVLMAQRRGFAEVSSGRLALVVTELGTNLARHAVQGQLLMALHEGPRGESIEILSLDKGPGMVDVDSCFKDGYSTSTTPGTGLGAVRRLADEFAVFSAVPAGTVIMARVAKQRGADGAAPTECFSHAAVSIAAPGETRCGDAWSVVQRNGVAAIMVVDGLGHGPHAEEAALASLAVFEAAPFADPSETLSRAHAVMRATRGAAAAVAHLDADGGQVRFCGAGNIASRLISGIEDRSLVSQHGTLGLQMGRAKDVDCEWPEHAILVMHSDGIASRWDFRDTPGLLQCDPAVIAGWLLRDHLREKDDATVVVVRRTGQRCP